jgi:hypothetical protein
MEHLLLAAHVVAGILFVGPVAVTASLFPRFAPLAPPAPNPAEVGDMSLPDTSRSLPVARTLHRITGVYGLLALIVPIIGLGLAAVQGRLGEIWITTAMVLTAVAGGLLALRIAPLQREALDTPDEGARLRVLLMLTGVFNLVWVTVVVLMIVRPGAE